MAARPEITRAVTRGAARLFRAHGWAVVTELTLANGRRADLLCLAPDGGLAICEVKSSPEDFLADQKWRDYLEFCEAFYFAVPPEFPQALLPPEPGLIVADAHGGEFLRESPRAPLAPARRKAVTLVFARLAAERLQMLADPDWRAVQSL